MLVPRVLALLCSVLSSAAFCYCSRMIEIKLDSINTVVIFKLYSEGRAETTLALSNPSRKTGELATIEVSDGTTSPREMDFPKTLPKRPSYLDDLRNVVPDQYITIELGGDFTMNREQYSNPTNYR